MVRIRNNRKTFNRSYRKTFHVLWEGLCTERKYFEWLVKQQDGIAVCRIRRSNDSATSCKGLLEIIKNYLEGHEQNISNGDEVWIIIDQDYREETDPYLKQLLAWHNPSQKHFVAISNPRFEYWLLLHFESANSLSDAQNCCDRLEQCYQKLDKKYKLCKDFPSQFYTLQKVQDAVCNAKKRQNNKSEDDPFYTDVHLLVEKLINN